MDHSDYGKTFRLWDRNIPFFRPEDEGKSEFLKPGVPGIERVTDVTIPEVVYCPCTWSGDDSQRIRPAVLVCPGGAYSILAWNLEGRDICAMLNRWGFHAFLLKYRCPDRRKAAAADAARAMRYIRAHAEKFEIDPTRLGMIGFSAGAHLAAKISAPADPVFYPSGDAIDEFSYRPDFTALIYPWQIAGKDLTLKKDFLVNETTPPALLIQSQDDFAGTENSLTWFYELQKSGVPAELHIWPEGGHGYGVMIRNKPTDDWCAIAEKWFRRTAGLK
ncbi:MAG: alpha/beta hydrolase [Lentisphaerae bacterium]|nr:alpha/beta hydrolase [Lentisphaerota bacterium]